MMVGRTEWARAVVGGVGGLWWLCVLLLTHRRVVPLAFGRGLGGGASQVGPGSADGYLPGPLVVLAGPVLVAGGGRGSRVVPLGLASAVAAMVAFCAPTCASRF